MVSDGGMVNGYGSYGWIIANADELTRGRGEAEGAGELMQSFRAEGYGMIAALRYILHAFTYTDNWSATNKTIHMYRDNLANGMARKENCHHTKRRNLRRLRPRSSNQKIPSML
jgi:hypothetical protein